MKKKCLAVGIILLFVGINIIPSTAQDIEKPSLPTSSGHWLYVGGSGPGNYSKIQDAMDNASDGDTVFVYDNSSPYYEHVVIDKSINLVGEERNTTSIDGGGSGCVVSINNDNVVISGFTIQGSGWGSDRYNAGITVISDYNIICGNNIINNNCSGITLTDDSSNNTIYENNIADNHHSGIKLNPSRGNNISRNIIRDNFYGFLSSTSSYDNVVYMNSIINNHQGIDLVNSAGYHISENTIMVNEDYGIYMIGSLNSNIYRNTIENNLGAIYMRDTSDVIISNNNISEEWNGIESVHSSNSTVSGNNFISGGIALTASQNLTIKNNIFFTQSIVISASSNPSDFIHTIENNTINGKPIRYYKNTNDIMVPVDAGQVILANCNNFILQNLNISSVHNAIQLGFSSNTTIQNNTIINNYYGITLSGSSENNIEHNNILKNDIAISLYKSSNNEINKNNISENYGYGISIPCSFSNRIYDNEIVKNKKGISINDAYGVANNNFIFKNNIADNEEGIHVEGYYSSPCNNYIFHNNFINNTGNAYDKGSNIWDNDYASGGNYWSDYTGTDGNYDGIGDSPYLIAGIINNIDNYPLMSPWNGLPALELDIRGGLGIHVIITNNEIVNASGCRWQIHVSGGILGLINRTVRGTVNVKTGESTTIDTGIFLGIGLIDITVKAANEEKTATGMHYFIFSIVK